MFGLAFFQETGLDPILLGQPKVWITSSDLGYLKNSSGVTASDGNLINTFNRYTDKAFDPVNVNTTNRAIYKVLPSQPHSYGYAGWTGSTGSQGQYSVGTTTDMTFMHRLNNSSTIYWVFKNDLNENFAASKFVASTGQSTGNRGFINYLANVDATNRRFGLTIRNDTPSVEAIGNLSTYQYDRTVDVPIMLMSWRTDLSAGVGSTGMWVYRNGVLDSTSLISNAPSNTAASTTTLRIGNRALGDGRFDGYTGDYIIFNTIHDEATHLKVCNFLRNKWRIT